MSLPMMRLQRHPRMRDVGQHPKLDFATFRG
jgi:hypothetical protein